jgi:ABC-type uncharacterized transport system permease subunit
VILFESLFIVCFWVLIFQGFGGWFWKRVLREREKRKLGFCC